MSCSASELKPRRPCRQLCCPCAAGGGPRVQSAACTSRPSHSPSQPGRAPSGRPRERGQRGRVRHRSAGAQHLPQRPAALTRRGARARLLAARRRVALRGPVCAACRPSLRRLCAVSAGSWPAAALPVGPKAACHGALHVRSTSSAASAGVRARCPAAVAAVPASAAVVPHADVRVGRSGHQEQTVVGLQQRGQARDGPRVALRRRTVSGYEHGPGNAESIAQLA